MITACNCYEFFPFTIGFFAGGNSLYRARTDSVEPGGRRDTFTPNRIADRMSRTTEANRSLAAWPVVWEIAERTAHAYERYSPPLPPFVPHRPWYPAAIVSFAPSSFAFTSARNLRARCFTDPAMMHRETIGIGMARGERKRDKFVDAIGRISAGCISGVRKRCSP